MNDSTQVRSKPSVKDSKSSGEKHPCLIMIEGDFLGEVYPLTQQTLIIGRTGEADIVVTEAGVSRRHAMIEKRDDAFYLVDLDSTNGTEVNGETVSERALNDGDKLRLGGVVFKFCFQDDIDQEYHRQLRQMAIKDGLTRIYNKRYFLETIGKEFIYALRNENRLSVVIFDIDHFKKLNDNYGHQAGDYVLRTIAAVIEKGIRGYDVFARYGGEEFVFLLRQLDLDTATQFAERIRRLVEEANFVFNGQTLPVTISVGVATFDERRLYPSETDLIAAADRYLYVAKDRGRNQVGNIEQD